mmetsp:Transcript_18763/g.53983  ORF Transcript_18763/g.53983 Transcript_18763/m.53983 type:complete len:201 (+) Transcript_18763:945-1547(+)
MRCALTSSRLGQCRTSDRTRQTQGRDREELVGIPYQYLAGFVRRDERTGIGMVPLDRRDSPPMTGRDVVGIGCLSVQCRRRWFSVRPGQGLVLRHLPKPTRSHPRCCRCATSSWHTLYPAIQKVFAAVQTDVVNADGPICRTGQQKSALGVVVKIQGIDGTDVRGDNGARRLAAEELDGVDETGGRHYVGQGGMLIGKER